MSLTCLSLATSSISLDVDNIPRESRTNIIGSLFGSFIYLSTIRQACVLKSSIVDTGNNTIRLESIPRDSIISLEIADSVSKYMTPPVGFAFRKLRTTLSAKNVLPVLLSPANAVTLLEGIPPYIDPLQRALKI